MKIGDLVKHKEDEVMGLILEGPIAYDVNPGEERWRPRFRVRWFDVATSCDEAEEDMMVISKTLEEDMTVVSASCEKK